MTTSSAEITEGSGLFVGTNTVFEGGLTKHLQRFVENDTDGAALIGSRSGAISKSIVSAKDDIRITEVTLTPTTTILAANEVVVDSQMVSACFKVDDAAGVLNSFTLIDEDDQGAKLYVVVLSSSTALGVENAAPSISDSNAANVLGWFAIETTDYLDVGGVKIACIRNIGLAVKAVSGTDDLYLGLINGSGTPTYTGTGLKARIGILG
ncbi:hypothetical protein [Phenylobacterium sp.]|uniref:hypothetical protein n=1 Tax=Phenylobacterium sp. TaxID=1871053 RepID=UPI0027361068|nr:hypothetical protein [Phenylobacterium sp.]MDP3854653.1 hypothetical protein [Phenylobacterium sp.]